MMDYGPTCSVCRSYVRPIRNQSIYKKEVWYETGLLCQHCFIKYVVEMDERQAQHAIDSIINDCISRHRISQGLLEKLEPRKAELEKILIIKEEGRLRQEAKRAIARLNIFAYLQARKELRRRYFINTVRLHDIDSMFAEKYYDAYHVEMDDRNRLERYKKCGRAINEVREKYIQSERLKAEAEKHNEELLKAKKQKAELLTQLLYKLIQPRESLVVRGKDYKRGNPLDNFVRNEWFGSVADIYNNKCFNCDSQNDLTLDHLWMPKNEGGNFSMLHKESRWLISNCLLLCRSCNSSKGERSPERFFSVTQIEHLLRCQEKLSRRMNQNSQLRITALKWYGKN